MINWRQLYNESQAIQPDDTNVPTERICRLVNIYKNDMFEQDLHRYASRLSKFSRSCQICTPKSYTIYKWIDTHISGEKHLFDFRLSGRSVSAFVYYWNKRLIEENNKRGQLSDFQRENYGKKSMIDFSINNLSNIDENIFIKKPIYISIISNLLTRFQMYYTYRKARNLCSSIHVHTQPMKTFRYLFQTNICPIFVCFINEDNHLDQLFWIFRHLITIFNWPLTTKIFSNRSMKNKSIFERMIINSLGFIDLSVFNQISMDLFSYLYRCLRTCQENGPMIFLFDESTIVKPNSSDYFLMAFLCDLIRFDLSISDFVVIPTCLYKSNLSFSQPFLFKELVDSFIKKFGIDKQLFQLIQTEEQKTVYQLIDCIFQHLGYDCNQLISTRLDFQHIIAAIELYQIDQPSTVESIYSTLQNLLKTCSFITTDQHQWNKITKEDIRKFKDIHSRSELISVIQKEYFLDIVIALTILSKTEHYGNNSRLYESEMFNQLKFLFFIFDYKQYLSLRPCKNLQHIVQHCQTRNYISPDYIPQKSMAYRDTILSDHEWSEEEEDEDELENGFLDHSDNDDEILMNGLSNKTSDTLKPFYRINYEENLLQLRFFARLFGSIIQSVISILKHHIDQHFESFSNEISPDILSIIRRAYSYQSFEHSNENSIFSEVIDETIYPLSIERLISLHDEFVQLLNCLISKR